MSEIFATVAGYVTDLGLDIGNDLIKGKYDEKKLRESLISYIEQQKKYYEVCSLAEEIDFQGLIEYIHNNLLDDVKKRISCLSSKERQIARQSVIDSAVAFSQADTPESKYRVAKSIAICLDIVSNFYRKKIDAQYYILASEVIDAVNENTKQTVDKAKEEIITALGKSTGSLYSLDSIAAKVQSGDISSLNERFKMLFASISSTHPLYPYYGFGWQNNDIISEPLIPEATEKYPVRYQITGPVRIGDRHITNLSLDDLNYAYRHQLQLVMKVEDARKYLGDILDPAQYEMKKLVGGELYAKPPEFPPAFACSIKVKDQVCFDYVLIRIQEILDDGTYIFSNREQKNTHLHFEFRVNIKDLLQNAEGHIVAARGDTGFTISIRDAINSEILKYVKFIKAITTEQDLRLHVLENDQDLVAGKVDNKEYSTGFSDIDEEIDFLERICDIEEYFGLLLHIEDKITEKEYTTVLLISELIRNNIIEEKWQSVSFTGILDERFRRNLIEMGAEMGAISYVGTSHIDLFGVHLELRFMRTFYDAVMEDHERIVKLAELSKEGDPIKVTFKAGENNKAICTLNIPEKLRETGETPLSLKTLKI